MSMNSALWVTVIQIKEKNQMENTELNELIADKIAREAEWDAELKQRINDESCIGRGQTPPPTRRSRGSTSKE